MICMPCLPPHERRNIKLYTTYYKYKDEMLQEDEDHRQKEFSHQKIHNKHGCNLLI